MKRTLSLPILILIGLAARDASAAVLFETGFEASEGYANGSLTGQNGWLRSGNDVWQVGAGTGTSGSAGVTVTGTGASWAWSPTSVTSALLLTTFSADVFINPNSPATNLQSEVGLDVFAPSSLVSYNNGLVASLRFAAFTPPPGGVGFNQGSYAMVYGKWGSSTVPFWQQPNSVPSNGGQGVIPIGAWFNVSMEMNFAAGTYRALINGVDFGLTSAIPYWTPNMPISDFDLYTRKESQATVRFDNYRITAVPEPLTIIGLASGLLFRRRTQNRK